MNPFIRSVVATPLRVAVVVCGVLFVTHAVAVELKLSYRDRVTNAQRNRAENSKLDY